LVTQMVQPLHSMGVIREPKQGQEESDYRQDSTVNYAKD
jgi:hypothetical protein